MNEPMTDRERTLRQVWSTGRYPSLAPNLLQPIANLVHLGGIDPGDRVLDVGCGTGNVALTARRSGASVVGIDITRNMLELARSSATLAGYEDIKWLEGDAERLPFPPTSFHVTLSNFGHIFAPEVDIATRELLRVTNPGGRMAFTAWSPDGLVGELASVLGYYLPREQQQLADSLAWGDPEHIRRHLDDVDDLSIDRRIARFRYVSPAHFWREFAEESGPLSPVVGDIDDPEVQNALRADALETLEDWFADNAIRVEYVLVRAVIE